MFWCPKHPMNKSALMLFQNAEDLVKNALEEKFHRAVPEVTVYLVEGVGNSTRIDYGTGEDLTLPCDFR